MEALDLVINLPVTSVASMLPSVCPALCISFPFISFPYVVTTLVSPMEPAPCLMPLAGTKEFDVFCFLFACVVYNNP